jgi:hypothetical protein
MARNVGPGYLKPRSVVDEKLRTGNSLKPQHVVRIERAPHDHASCAVRKHLPFMYSVSQGVVEAL